MICKVGINWRWLENPSKKETVLLHEYECHNVLFKYDMIDCITIKFIRKCIYNNLYIVFLYINVLSLFIAFYKMLYIGSK